MRRFWTEKELEVLISEYPNTPTDQLAKKLNCDVSRVHSKASVLGLKKTEEFMNSAASGRLKKGRRVSKATEFKKGQKPWNKGLKVGRLAPEYTLFKKGRKPHNFVPVGSIRPTSKDFYLRIKVAEPNKWEFLHKRNWIAVHGPIPKGHVLRFIDGDKNNCNVENLILVDYETNAQMNAALKFPEELQPTHVALYKLNKAIRDA